MILQISSVVLRISFSVKKIMKMKKEKKKKCRNFTIIFQGNFIRDLRTLLFSKIHIIAGIIIILVIKKIFITTGYELIN
jgi:hypothetical protein